MRIIALVDGNSNTVRCVGYLRNRIDDQTVIFLSIVGSNDIKTVTDIEQSGKVVLVCGCILVCKIFLTEFFDQCIDLRCAFLV